MSDIRINTSPRPIPEQIEATESHPQVPANARLDNPKSPDAEYDKAMKTGLPEHVLHQQGQGLGSDENDLSNAVEAGMQSASEWLLRQGKLMQSEVEHRSGDSTEHSDSPGRTHDASVEKK